MSRNILISALPQVVATNPSCTGMGIEEDTAGVKGEVWGSGSVIIIEGFGITSTNMMDLSDRKPVSVRNLSVDILAGGGKFLIGQKNSPAQK